ncbi:MAG: AMP-binding protein [Prevotella sp.]|jgi:long-chain acyl-CoA synthetase
MEPLKNFNEYIKDSIVKNWDHDALSDYKGITLQYHDVARKIEKLHIMFESIGLKQGDKVALCGRNSANWATVFLAILTYGAVAVPIQHEFKPEQVYNIINHSEAKLLFVGDIVATTLDHEKMPDLMGIVYIPDFSVVFTRCLDLENAREHLNEMFGKKFPKFFRKEHINYYEDKPDDLALINYTSGTTGFSKGVMLTYRSLLGNLKWAHQTMGPLTHPGDNILSFLPLAHMYGLMLDFLFGITYGLHIQFLTRLPSPTLVSETLQDLRPSIVSSVPLVVEKIIRKKVFPIIETNKMKLLLNMPIVSHKVREHIRDLVMQEFGGNLKELIIGGAGLNKEVERFLLDIQFPVTVGYGATETGPMITYCDYHEFKAGCCGKAVFNMEVKILSDDPQHKPGEIITRGENVMTGYYKNPEATKAAIDEEGWFHTGDLGTMDESGLVYIRGRIKNMLLGADGQNVYPEEIENKLNNMAMVNECLVIQKGNKLIGLVHPDMEAAKSLGLTQEELLKIMEQNRKDLNASLPQYCKLAAIVLHEKEFEKTPKKSIKRYLYQNAI